MRRARFTIPISIVVFLAATLVGTYLVRRRILEQHMITAMEMGDEAMVRSSLDSWPYPVNVRDELGTTPLNWAVRFGSGELVAEMVARGADVNALATHPVQPYVGLWNPALPKILRQGRRIVVAPPSRRPEYEIITPTRGGGPVSPLFIAAQNGREDVARLLLAHGAQVDRGRSGGRTPLEAAVSNGHRGLVQMFLEAGANVDGGDRSTMGLLYVAVWLGGSDVVRILLDHGADVKRTDRDGRTALHRAVLSRAKTSAELLLGRGASVNARDKKGNTPLHLAAVHGRGALAQLLLSHGADVTIKNHDGKTALTLAEEKGRKEVAELLRKHGATTEAETRNAKPESPSEAE